MNENIKILHELMHSIANYRVDTYGLYPIMTFGTSQDILAAELEKSVDFINQIKVVANNLYQENQTLKNALSDKLH